MDISDLSSLKSGTDIRGTACGAETELTDENVRRITRGYLEHLKRRLGKPAKEMRIAVGHDCRISSERIKNDVLDVLASCGAKVYDCSLSSTPAMFMAVIRKGLTSSVQITASHMPPDKNGLKFFDENGGFEGRDIEEILEFAKEASGEKPPESKHEKLDFMSEYEKELRDMIIEGVDAKEREKPLKGFKIAVDAGNGVGGFYAVNVLEKLGADISSSVFLEPDGNFPNHIPNPELKDAMDSITDAVKKSGADLGIIFDTDVDRAALVDSDAREINRNALIALASVIAVGGRKNCVIVTDSVTSDGLAEFIENELSCRHYRYRRGYKNVIDKARELSAKGEDCPLAMETSGHAALKENYFLDDGAYLMTKLVIEAANLRKEGKKIGSLIKKLKMPVEETERRYKILSKDFKEAGEKIIDDLEKYAVEMDGWTVAKDNREGVRISLDKERGDGWMLLRLSVHDPVLPFNAESNSVGGVEKILFSFDEFIRKYDNVTLKK